MKYWLLKTEPEEWSWEQQVNSGKKGAEWNGVRNFQAAKNLKNTKLKDKCFFYHTGTSKSIVGIPHGSSHCLVPVDMSFRAVLKTIVSVIRAYASDKLKSSISI